MTHYIDSRIKITFEFEATKTEGNKTFFEVHCRTYKDGSLVTQHKVADALREYGKGLYVFPLADNIHKPVRDAYVRDMAHVELATKARWTDNGFLFKEK